MEIVVILIVGAVAGWLGSTLYKGSGLGLFGNIAFGIIGGFVGYWLLDKLHISLGTGWVAVILTGALGAIILLFLLNILVKKRR